MRVQAVCTFTEKELEFIPKLAAHLGDGKHWMYANEVAREFDKEHLESIQLLEDAGMIEDNGSYSLTDFGAAIVKAVLANPPKPGYPIVVEIY